MNKFTCPHCGQTYIVTVELEPLAQVSRRAALTNAVQRTMGNDGRHTYHADVYPAWRRNERGQMQRVENEPDIEEQYEPARAPTKESDVTVPFRQALITGTVLGVPLSLGWFVVGGEKPAAVAPTIFWAIVAVDWLRNRGELRRLMWRTEVITRRDLNRDGQIGEPEPTGRIVINPRREPLPKTWQHLPAEKREADIYHFTKVVWERQQAGVQKNGQKALRGLALPSGFELKDDIHGWILNDYLRPAGVIRESGSSWSLEAPPAAVRNIINAQNW